MSAEHPKLELSTSPTPNLEAWKLHTGSAELFARYPQLATGEIVSLSGYAITVDIPSYSTICQMGEEGIHLANSFDEELSQYIYEKQLAIFIERMGDEGFWFRPDEEEDSNPEHMYMGFLTFALKAQFIFEKHLKDHPDICARICVDGIPPLVHVGIEQTTNPGDTLLLFKSTLGNNDEISSAGPLTKAKQKNGEYVSASRTLLNFETINGELSDITTNLKQLGFVFEEKEHHLSITLDKKQPQRRADLLEYIDLFPDLPTLPPVETFPTDTQQIQRMLPPFQQDHFLERPEFFDSKKGESMFFMIEGHEEFLDKYCTMAHIKLDTQRRNLLLAELTRYHIELISHMLHETGGWFIEQTEYKGFTPTIIAFNNIHEPNPYHNTNSLDKPTFLSIRKAIDTISNDRYKYSFIEFFEKILDQSERNQNTLNNLKEEEFSQLFKAFISIVGCNGKFDVHIKEYERQTPGSILIGGSVVSAAARGLQEAKHAYIQNQDMYEDSTAILIMEPGILEQLDFTNEELAELNFTSEKTDIVPLVKGFGPLPFSLISL